jgi:GxxExxY protein
MININDLTKEIIGAAYKVHSALGAGFLEKIYENALLIELKKIGFKAIAQCPISVFYENELVGNFFADILVEDALIIELKSVENLTALHEKQLVNYLTATGINDGLLINFGSSCQIKRKFRLYKKNENIM